MSKSIQFDDVADLYDAYVTVDFDIPFYLKETAHCKESILELMCGTGRVSLPLLATGKQMVCVDYSHQMLTEFARKIHRKNYQVQLVQMDVTQLAFRRLFECILLPFHSFSEIVSTTLQTHTLELIAAHLTSDGVALISLHNPSIRVQAANGQHRHLGEFPLQNHHYLHLSSVNRYDPVSQIVSGTQFYVIYDAAHQVVEQRKLAIHFQLITDADFRIMSQYAGLEIVAMYGDYSSAPFDETTSKYMIYKLKKAAG